MRAWLWSVPVASFPVYVKTGTFALNKVGRATLAEIQPGDTIFAYLSGKQVIAGLFEVTSGAFEDTTPLVSGRQLPHRVRVRKIAVLSEEAWVPYEAFSHKLDVGRGYSDFRAVVQKVLHPLPKVDEKVLEFLVRARQVKDVDDVIEAYEAYREAKAARSRQAAAVHEEQPAYVTEEAAFDWPEAMVNLQQYLGASGFLYQPWQVAAYVTALRTKPFVILAGVTGIGKSQLPRLVETATGGTHTLIPVRPDWTDSTDVLGYVDLQQRFRPGAVLHAAKRATQTPDHHVTCILDEMNLARVEQYFAEMLSIVEDRKRNPGGIGYTTPPLLGDHLTEAASEWRSVQWGHNFAIVGTVNMDESTHGFSRKVLDRAFTLELADVDFSSPPSSAYAPSAPRRWPLAAWLPVGVRAQDLTDSLHTRIAKEQVRDTLSTINTFLMPAQLQIAYRTRDEILFFVHHAHDYPDAFRTSSGDTVDPLDLALHMKVLPRLMGGSPALRHSLLGLLGWTTVGAPLNDPMDAREILDRWHTLGRPFALPDTRFPRTAARLCLMWERYIVDGYTAFWI